MKACWTQYIPYWQGRLKVQGCREEVMVAGPGEVGLREEVRPTGRGNVRGRGRRELRGV